MDGPLSVALRDSSVESITTVAVVILTYFDSIAFYRIKAMWVIRNKPVLKNANILF